nr:ABC transporter ATP-binding protein [Spiroplasma monobiae]
MAEKTTLESTQEVNIQNQNKNIKPEFKTKRSGRSFFAIIMHYLKRHPMLGVFLVLLTLASSVTSVLSPKIIENIMSILTAPTRISAAGITDLSEETINRFLHSLTSGPKITAFGSGQNVMDYIFTTGLFGFNLKWQDWIYVQLGLFGSLAIFTFASNYIAGIMGKNIEIELRNKTLERLVKQDMSYYSDKKIGEILTKIVSDTQIIGDQAQQVPVTMMSAAFTFFGALIMMFTINTYLTVVVIITMTIIVTSIFSTFGIVKKAALKTRDSITDINGDVTDRIATVRLIKASGTENYET